MARNEVKVIPLCTKCKHLHRYDKKREPVMPSPRGFPGRSSAMNMTTGNRSRVTRALDLNVLRKNTSDRVGIDEDSTQESTRPHGSQFDVTGSPRGFPYEYRERESHSIHS